MKNYYNSRKVRMSEERKALQNLEAVLWLTCCNGQANPDLNWLKCKLLHQNAYSKLEKLERAAFIEVVREQPSEVEMARMQETSINAANLTPPGKN